MSLLIYTDGSCIPNPGAGGWAAIILTKEETRIATLHGCERDTTNNRMEFAAIHASLIWLTENESPPATIYSDSQYCLDAMRTWVWSWEKSGWRKKKKNLDLIRPMHELQKRLTLKYRWVRGHNRNFWNEQADYAAETARRGNSASPLHQPDRLPS